MSYQKPKSINGLMKYLRDHHNININGSNQKLKLSNIGYYHGYKGYRYIGKANNTINYNDFKELEAIYTFDSRLKALLYPHVMFIETALKNRVLEVLIEETKSDSFVDVYNQVLIDYKDYSILGRSFRTTEEKNKAEKEYSSRLQRRIELRDKIYSIQTKSYNKGNRIVKHYYDKHLNLPIWAIFELLSLGEFGHLVSCIEINTRHNISKKLGIRQSDDTDGRILELIIYAVRDLRNSIAHNDVIFDTRFNTRKISHQLTSNITNTTSVHRVNFSKIVDYIILIVYILKLLGVNKTELKQLIVAFSKLSNELKNQVSPEIYNQIVPYSTYGKLNNLFNYIKS